MSKRKSCEYCTNPLVHHWQIKFCSPQCAGLASRQGEVTYTFSADGKTGYGKIPTGEVFMFDSDEFYKVNSKPWYRNKKGAHGETYITDSNGNHLHRLILDNPVGLYVDHINLDTLDNRKCNLRICNHRENLCNRNLQPNNTSGVSGVSWKKRRKTWNARIKYYGEEIHLGAYHSFLEAVQARNEGMRWLYGEFGRYNDVPEAPTHIKEYVQNKCSRFISESTVYFCPEVTACV